MLNMSGFFPNTPHIRCEYKVFVKIYVLFFIFQRTLTLVLLSPDIPCFANSVDPDQLASEEANWSGSALFAIKYANL